MKILLGRMMRRLVREVLTPPALVIGALIFLWEEVLWFWLGRAMNLLGTVPAVAHVETAVRGLPPYGALAAFLVPTLLTYPPKLMALWFIATGHIWTGVILLALLEVLAAALLARVYTLCRPALHSLKWFAKGEALIRGWSRWAHDKLGIGYLRRAMNDVADESRRAMNGEDGKTE